MDNPPKEKPPLAAVISIGSRTTRMVIAEFDSEGSWRVIDAADKPVHLGRDVFNKGIISQKAMQIVLQVLKHFQELIGGWGIDQKNIRVISTSALREAVNRDAFLDRVEVRTGFRVEVIDGIEENRLSYIAVQHALEGIRGEISRGNAVIIEVGGGSTEIMLLRRGKIIAVHSLTLGTVRVQSQLKESSSFGQKLAQYIKNHIRPMKERLAAEMKTASIRHFIAIGTFAKLGAQVANAEHYASYSILQKKAFINMVNSMKSMTIEECVQAYNISFDDAEGLIPAMMIYQIFMDGTHSEDMIIPDAGIEEGMFLEMGPDSGKIIEEKFHSQVIASASNLAKKYNYDSAHSHHVTNMALIFFDSLTEAHNLNRHSRLLLEVAAILHDIGTFVRASGHHKHGSYLVNNSEIFGLHRRDLNIIANIVRYHRKNTPTSNHSSYTSLPREDRIIVLKLASILRVADALDRGHGQRIQNLAVKQHEDEVLLTADYQGDISIERFSLTSKGKMFEDVFGLKLLIN